MAILQKWSEGEDRHWLVDTETGEESGKAMYQQFTYLNGFVGFTAYWAEKEGVLPADQFCAMVGVS